LQANEQNIKISIKQTQTQPQYSMPHGQRRVVTCVFWKLRVADYTNKNNSSNSTLFKSLHSHRVK